MVEDIVDGGGLGAVHAVGKRGERGCRGVEVVNEGSRLRGIRREMDGSQVEEVVEVGNKAVLLEVIGFAAIRVDESAQADVCVQV